MKHLKYFLIITVLFSACEKNNPTPVYTEFESGEAEEVNEFHKVVKEEFNNVMEIPLSMQPAPPESGRKLIKTSNLSLQVEDLTKTSRTVDSLVKQSGAFVSNDRLENYPQRKSRMLTIRVPAGKMEALLDKLAGTGDYIAERNFNVQDVSEEFVDTEIRIKSKKAAHDQYLKLLGRASKIEDILKIENEIRKITEEIEAKEGRLRYLSDRVELSTIQLELYQEVLVANAPPTKSFWLKAAESGRNGWSLVKVITLGIITIWPVILLMIISILVLRVYKRRKFKLKTN